MSEASSAVADAVLSGDRRAAVRLLSRVEAGDETTTHDLKVLFRAGGHASVLGITGPPGAGKSTVVDHLTSQLRARGSRVAVLAVDPSSPFSGGAILGDRVRMSRHGDDPGVLIRSMAARGMLGGLAPAIGDALVIFDAMRFDIILVETVGVGQNEIDILTHADTVILLQTAHSGDDIQTVKAGILEIADVFAVNKADSVGTDKMVAALEDLAAQARSETGWTRPVVKTIANTGTGIPELVAAIDRHGEHRRRHPVDDRLRRRRQVRARLMALGKAALRRQLAEGGGLALDREIDAIIARITDPHTVASTLFKSRS